MDWKSLFAGIFGENALHNDILPTDFRARVD
jgi:hypothetical protein